MDLPPFDFPYVQPTAVAFRDLDSFGHVNNAVYLSYAEDARLRYLLQLTGAPLEQLSVIVAESTIRYLRPVFYGEALQTGMRIGSIGTKSFVMEWALQRLDDQVIVADGRTVMVWYDYRAGKTMRVPDDFRAAVELAQTNPGAS